MVLPNGEVRCTAVPGDPRVNVIDRAWFQQALQSREMIIADVVIGRILGVPVITLGKAMRDEAERIKSVFYLALGLDWLQRELGKIRLQEGARLTVVDNRGMVIVRFPDPEEWTGKNVAHFPLVQRFLAAEHGDGILEETGLDGVRKLIAHARLLTTASGGSFHLWTTVPKQVVEAPAQREALIELGIMLTVLIAVLGLMTWGGNVLLLRPLLTLSRLAARIGAGDFEARSGLPHTDNEVGRLAKTLDQTADAIGNRERKLARVNRAAHYLRGEPRAAACERRTGIGL